jgi:hypothetical protein
MDVGHAHEPRLRSFVTRPAGSRRSSDHHRAASIELVPVAEQLDVGQPDRILALDAQRAQPVGRVDKILVEHRHAAEDRRLTVVNPVAEPQIRPARSSHSAVPRVHR